MAIVGASASRQKFGNKAVRAYVTRGHAVFPVNPNEETIEGLKVYRSVEDIPHALDRVCVYVPPEVTLQVLAGIAKKGTDELYLNPGTESSEVIAKADELGLNVIRACSIVAIGESPARYF